MTVYGRSHDSSVSVAKMCQTGHIIDASGVRRIVIRLTHSGPNKHGRMRPLGMGVTHVTP
ncbi:hypothetical protein NOVOSPHI9U_70133 [Novosphingobium sp. 9U]|nr:hypothetical protein NOVOSPHI9U_70133 [Novosphingobium sp. 9U]